MLSALLGRRGRWHWRGQRQWLHFAGNIVLDTVWRTALEPVNWSAMNFLSNYLLAGALGGTDEKIYCCIAVNELNDGSGGNVGHYAISPGCGGIYVNYQYWLHPRNIPC